MIELMVSERKCHFSMFSLWINSRVKPGCLQRTKLGLCELRETFALSDVLSWDHTVLLCLEFHAENCNLSRPRVGCRQHLLFLCCFINPKATCNMSKFHQQSALLLSVRKSALKFYCSIIFTSFCTQLFICKYVCL